MRPWWVLGVSAALTLTTACGDDDSQSSGSARASPPRSSAPTTAPFTTAVPRTTTTTTTTMTTTAATTAATTTTLPALVAGWQPIEVAAVEGHPAFPCCGDTWHGVPSPALPDDGTPLADGDYAIDGSWPADLTQPLDLAVRRFEQCSLLPAGGCEPAPAGFEPDQLGIDRGDSAAISLPLDDRLRVVMTGFDGSFDPMVAAEGTGADLADVATAIESSYEALIGSRIAAGEDAYAVVDDVRANPQGGFVDGLDGTGLSLSWLHGDAPPVLLQQVFRYVDDRPAPGRGTDALRLPSIHVEDGRITLFVYAGYQP